MEDAREEIGKWREEYNEFQPHSVIEDLPPRQFAEQFARGSKSREILFLAGAVLMGGSYS